MIFLGLITVLGFNVVFYGDTASAGPNQVALVVMSAIVIGIGRFWLGLSYHQLEQDVFRSVYTTIPACFILFLIGPLISLWIVGGVVPGLIYYGLEIIHPSFFLPISFLCCCVVSVSIGSSWSTIGTVGLALIGIGETLGLPAGMSAGAVISGAYFGDKMSPLSDTTNMSAAVTEVELFTHIRYMFYTTIPAAILSIIAFTILGLFQNVSSDLNTQGIEQMQLILKQTFHISPLILIPPLVVLGLIAKKTPALPAIFMGCVAGVFCALFLQEELLYRVAENMELSGLYPTLITITGTGPVIDVGHPDINSLLNRGGMASMLYTVWFIFAAMFFGGALEATGVVNTLTKALLRSAQSAGQLAGATLATCLVVNMTTCEQYLAIALPGKMFKKSYKDQNLAPENLSRALEDGGTMTAVLIPWNTGGVYATGVLGISPLAYAPYCFFNLLCPAVSIFLSTFNYNIRKAR
jgi:NhaC family Na+:H+ antiporter